MNTKHRDIKATMNKSCDYPSKLEYLIQTTTDKRILKLLNKLWWKHYFKARSTQGEQSNG